MKTFEIGMLAKSKAGHDKNRVYLIIDVDELYVTLADGEVRTLETPKKKKKKHVQLIVQQYDIQAIDDVAIKRILKIYNNRTTQEEEKCQKLT